MSIGHDRGLLAALRDYLDQWQGQSGVAVELITEPATGFATRLSPNAEVQLLRIVQEALANVRKHAGARRANVRLAEGDGFLVAIVEDDGSGFDPDALGRTTVPRFGLATMRERAEELGGSLELLRREGGGTLVRAVLPRNPS